MGRGESHGVNGTEQLKVGFVEAPTAEVPGHSVEDQVRVTAGALEYYKCNACPASATDPFRNGQTESAALYMNIIQSPTMSLRRSRRVGSRRRGRCLPKSQDRRLMSCSRREDQRLILEFINRQFC
jgi:hypothetical protein